jgi:hypothetical protein
MTHDSSDHSSGCAAVKSVARRRRYSAVPVRRFTILKELRYRTVF